MLNMIEMKKFVSKWTILPEFVDLSQEVWKHWTIKESFWLQQNVVYIKPFTPRIWTTTQANAIL